MKKAIIILILVTFGGILSAQKIAPDTYVIKFKDKNNNGYSVDKPEAFLSQRAIDRRVKYNIPVTTEDLPVTEDYIKQIKDLGFELYAVSKWMNLVVVHSTDSTLIIKAGAFDFVDTKAVERNYKKKTKLEKAKKVELVSTSDEQTTIDYGMAKNQIKMLNVHNLHNRGFFGEGIVMAILDAGFYNVDSLEGFESIRTNNQILGIKDFVERDGDVYEDASHGMQVLSTIAAHIPGKLVGSAPKAKFWLLRSEDERSEYIVEEYYWVAAAEYADSVGADIIHSSLGYNNFDDNINSHTYQDMNGDIAPASIAADISARKGILVVTSAGNEGNDSWKYITSPADADSIITVGAVNGAGKLSDFSSRGPTPDGRIKPDAMAQGSFIWVLSRRSGAEISFGTSFSAPLLAGAVACLWQANPEFSNMEIINAVQIAGSRYASPDSEFGYGITDFEKADQYLKQVLKEKKKDK
jgi:subtilisin family serine protease